MRMKVEFVMPKAGLTNTEGTIGVWKAAEGAFVKKGDTILEIENEKTSMDVESPADGFLHIIAREGEVIVVGGTMAYICSEKEEYKALCETSIEAEQKEPKISVPNCTELVMPKAGLTNTEGTIAAWQVKEGAKVKKGDVLLELENEKTTMEFQSTADGFIHIVANAGEVVAVGGTMGYVAESSADYEAIKAIKKGTTMMSAPDSKAEGKVTAPVQTSLTQAKDVYIKASPLAKKIAKKADIDLALVTGTGPNGRVLERDVTKYLEEVKARPVMVKENEEPILIPMTSTRKAIAKNMYNSLKSMAQTSDSVEIDVTDLVYLRRKFVKMQDKIGAKITLNDLLSYVTLNTIKKHPLANATWTDEGILTYPYINLSMAVATDYGLTSPVVNKADRMSLGELSKALKDIVVRAREGKLASSQLGGGTFTITNMGVFPVDHFNPIVNPPQSCIIGFGRCVDKPVVYQGEITIRTMMFLSVTYDHRVFDGSEVGMIMRDLKDCLENPELLLI